MSGNSKAWMIGLGAIAVVAIVGVTLFLVTQPPTPSEQAAGTIGAAERYRGEQIKEGDVGVGGPGEVTGPPTEMELAEALGRAPLEVRSNAFDRLSDTARLENLGRAPADLTARLFDNLSERQQLDLLRQAPADLFARALQQMDDAARAPYLAALRVRADDWARMQQSVRAQTAERLDADRRFALSRAFSLNQKAALVLAAAPALRLEALRAAPADLHAELVARGPLSARIEMVRTAERAVLDDLGVRAQSARNDALILGRAPLDLQLALLDRASPEERADLVARFENERLFDLFGRAGADLQQGVLDRALQQDCVDFFDRLSDHQRLELLRQAPADLFARALQQLDDAARAPYLAAIRLSADDWARMEQSAREQAAERFTADHRLQLSRGFSADAKADFFRSLSLDGRYEMARGSLDAFARVFSRALSAEKATVFDLASAQERLEMLRVAPATLQSDLYGRLENSERAALSAERGLQQQ